MDSHNSRYSTGLQDEKEKRPELPIDSSVVAHQLKGPSVGVRQGAR